MAIIHLQRLIRLPAGQIKSRSEDRNWQNHQVWLIITGRAGSGGCKDSGDRCSGDAPSILPFPPGVWDSLVLLGALAFMPEKWDPSLWEEVNTAVAKRRSFVIAAKSATNILGMEARSRLKGHI